MAQLLRKIIKKYNVCNENEIPGKLREYLKKIPPYRMRKYAYKITVGSIVKYFDNLISPKLPKQLRETRVGDSVNVANLIDDILKKMR